LKKLPLAAGLVFLAACSDSTSPTVAGKNLKVSAAVSAAGNPIITEAEIARQTENTPPTKNWVFYTRGTTTSGAFVIGPSTAPFGVGSFNMQTPDGSAKGYLFNFDYVGKSLSNIDAIAYDTYRTAGSDPQVAALNIEVDINGSAPGGFTTLVFEPIYNTSQGNITNDTWQHWNAFSGGNAIWWSSNSIPSAPNRDTFVSWSTIVAANPDAVILGGFGVNQGSGNGGLNSSVDGLTLGVSGTTTTYDFEPYVTATSKQSCMNGGWTSVKRADGSSFKNQGDCVSYLNTGN
jgi:hypothetical protein